MYFKRSNFNQDCLANSLFIVKDDTNTEIANGEYQDNGYFSCIDGGGIFNVINLNTFEKVDYLDTTCTNSGNWNNYNSDWQCWSG